MPRGIYIRTEKHGFRKAWETSREKMLEGCSRGGKIGGKNSYKYNYEEHCKNLSKAQRKWMKENPEVAHEHHVKCGKISGKTLGKTYGSINLKNKWNNKKDIMIENCRKGGKVGGKTTGSKNIIKWIEENPEKHRRNCSKAGKIGGRISIQKFQNLKPSPIELIVRNYLDEHQIKHQDNVWFGHKEADIVLPKYNLIIECDGFWHDKPETKVKDKLKTKFFNKLGYRVLRLTGTEIRRGLFGNKILKKMGAIKWKPTSHCVP